VSDVVRTWLGFLALGAGLIHVALVIGSPAPVAAVLLLVGVAEFVWGVLTFARPTPPWAQLARWGALLPVVAWALVLIVAGADTLGPLTSTTQLLPMLVASLFDLLVTVGLTVLVRSSGATGDAETATSADSPAPRPPARYLVAVLAGAAVIAALTTPALAATEAGRTAPQHGSTGFFGGHDH
jgi:hypothetical protein